MFKAMLLQSWYSLSDRELSENLEDRISFSHFCGFSLHHQVPDNSTICRFRNEIHQKGLAKPLLDMINAQIEAGGLEIKAGVIVDSSLLESARRPRKQQDVFPVDEDGDASESQTSGGYNVETTYSDDSEAAWTVKGKKFCYGYKAHIAVDAEHGFILAGHATPANRPDCKEMMTVVRAVVCKQGLRSLRKRATAASNIDMSWKLLGISMGSCIKPPATGPFPSPNAWSFEPSADSAAERSGPSAH